MRTTAQIQTDFDKVADDSITYGQMQTELLMDIRRLLLIDIAASFNIIEGQLVEAINAGSIQFPAH